VHIAQKLIVGIEEATILEIVAFDTRKSDGVLVFTESIDASRIGQKRNDRAFPACPAPRRFKLHLRVAIGEALVIGGYHIAALGFRYMLLIGPEMIRKENACVVGIHPVTFET